MKDVMVRPHPLPMLTSRLVAIVVFAAVLSAVPFHTALAATPPPLGGAASFAVLAGSAVTCTDSVVAGDVGVALGGAVTQTNCTIFGAVHLGDAVSQQAYADFLTGYGAVAAVPCDVDLTGFPLAGQSLAPAVYCFNAADAETGGTLTLLGSPTDTWIFKIGTGGTGAFTGTNFTVVMPGGVACNNNVFWWTAQAATLTDSVFIGTTLAGADFTATRSSLDGHTLAGGTGTTSVPTGAVTLTGPGTSICGLAPPPPPTDCDKDHEDHDHDHHDKDHHDKDHDNDQDKDDREG